MANIKEQIDILVKIQKIETETRGIKSMLSDVSKKVETLDVRLKDFEQTIENEESGFNDLKKKYRSYESDTQMNLSQAKKSQEKLRLIKTNKEYQSSLKEIEKLKTNNSQIEDKMLECLDSMDEAEKVIAAKKDEYLQISEQLNNEKKIIDREAEEGKKKLVELNANWKKVSGIVEPELLKKYIIIREQQARGIAIVPAKDTVCRGCNVNLPPQMYNELQRCDSLRLCPNCQRIIYWEKL